MLHRLLFLSLVTLTTTIIAQPHAEFLLSASSGCVDDEVVFINLSFGGIVSYEWDFGDGTTSALVSPTHTYSDAGSFEISLTVVDGDGLSDTWTETYVVRPPVAKFVFAPSLGCSLPHTVFYTDNSILPDTWFWEFGDGATSTLQNPIHNYTTAGEFQIKLTVIDTMFGCVSSAVDTIRIGIPDANITSPSGFFGCAPLSVDFTEGSTNDGFGEIVSWNWDFGDGNSSDEQEPNHIYEAPGIYSVSLTVTNSIGCENTVTQTNYVQAIGPAVDFLSDVTSTDCPDLTVNFTDYTIFSAPITSWSWDFGDDETSSLMNPTHVYADFGTFDVALTVTDIDGCSRTLEKENFINILDTISPAFTICPSNQLGSVTESCDFTLPDYASLATVSDNCSGPLTITQTPPIGTIITTNQLITLQTSDDNDNIATCSFMVNLIDEIDPAISCPADQFIDFDEDCSYILPDYTHLVTSSDNCTEPIITQSPLPGTILYATQTVTITAQDTASNSASCTFTVTPEDILPPTIDCPSNISIDNDPGLCGAIVSYTEPIGVDNCSALTTQTEGLTTGSEFPVGTTTNEFTVTDDAGLNASCTFTITVIDIEAPVLTCPTDQTGVLSASCDFVLPDYSALASTTDNCTSTFSIAQSPEAGSTITTDQLVTLTTSDESGNITTCNFMVYLLDETPPTILCPEDQMVSYDESCTYTLLDYTSLASASDNCEMPEITQSPAPGTLITSVETITLTAVDSAGNNVSCSFDVIPSDLTAPTIVCPENITLNNDTDACGATVTYPTPMGTDNCSVITSLTEGFTTGSFFPIGTTTNTFIATDDAGLTNSCSFEITIIDAQLPSIDCPEDVSEVNDSSICGAIIDYTDIVYSDNCPDVIFSQISGLSSGDLYPVGTTTNTFEVIDQSGNSSICTFEVNVIDAEAPSIICPTDITTCDSIITYNEPTVNDNCDILSTILIEGIATGEQFPVGFTSNTYEVTDVNGNSATCAFVVERFPLPQVDAGSDQIIDAGFSVNLTANADLPGTFHWSPDYRLSNTNEQTVIASPEKTTTYTVQVTSENGCVAEDFVTITVELAIEVNNFLSPNSDGKNDTWIIKGHYLLDGCNIQIIDSWGNKVYESIGYDNLWDGTTNGELIQEGNYYYIIDCKDGQPLTGSITLIR